MTRPREPAAEFWLYFSINSSWVSKRLGSAGMPIHRTYLLALRHIKMPNTLCTQPLVYLVNLFSLVNRIVRAFRLTYVTDATSTTRLRRSHWVAPPKRCGPRAPWRPPTTPAEAGASARSPRSPDGPPSPRPDHAYRRGLPRRTAPLLRHRLQQRLLRRARPARRAPGRTRHHRPW